ncbi:hypothetical protein [uncultured Roseobacter sp.]|uniref:hypothetical protein n=1 Tax=uncultured Roseobacter sp. TaxID=114847 RepID=UPI0026265214|nr:hypothetical protein [uncultured Roseobacter sp.]
MTKLKTLAILAALTGLALPAQAADFSDPTWPCVQRKVETLSLGLMWPNPVDPDAEPASDALRADIADLAGYLSLRRVELDSLQPRIDTFAETYNGDAEALGMVFASVFDTLSKRRTRIITGIGDFSLSQIALADKIDLARAEMDTILANSEPDFDRVDLLEEQLDWDQVIYTDRQRNISYLCETPTLLERRLFSIAQMLQQAVQDQG